MTICFIEWILIVWFVFDALRVVVLGFLFRCLSMSLGGILHFIQ
jgi:hypothetical protein